MKITFEDKVGLLPKGTRENQVWDDDINEIKDVVNINDDNVIALQQALSNLMIPVAEQSSSIKFDRIGGYINGTWDAPISGDVTIVSAGAIEGCVSCMIWKDTVKPRLLDGDAGSVSGTIDLENINVIYFHHTNGKFNLNIVSMLPNPTITILGDNPVDTNQGEEYVDAGATAKDAVDNDITADIIVTNNVDTNTLGQYTVDYEVTDSANQTSTKSRVVNVVEVPPSFTAPVITVE